MNLTIHEHNGVKAAELVSEKIVISTVQDALDLMANADYMGARKVLVHARQITPAFFDLKTRLAGDILQKFSNYQVALAIVGDFENVTSKSLKDFIYESNKRGNVLFISTLAEALTMLGAA